jgi:hypothetical protein
VWTLLPAFTSLLFGKKKLKLKILENIMYNFQYDVPFLNQVAMKCLSENYCIIIVTFCQILKECETVFKFKNKIVVSLKCNNKVVTVHTMKAYRGADM